MQSLKFGLVAAAMVCAFSVTAEAAECTRITALGEMLTHDTAVLFSNNALKNTLAGKGLVGKGPVHTTCKTGSTTTTCYSTQTACKGATPKTCLGAWLCV
jgi:hypothetical protein